MEIPHPWHGTDIVIDLISLPELAMPVISRVRSPDLLISTVDTWTA